MTKVNSRIPGFHHLSPAERLSNLLSMGGLGDIDRTALSNFGAIEPSLASTFVENVIGTMALPLGIATNFRINDVDVMVPMAVEESSVIAAASHGAKLARAGGGFHTSSSASIMTGQVQILLDDTSAESVNHVVQGLREHRDEMIKIANIDQDVLISHGGGAKEITWRHMPEIRSIIVHIDADCRDAMGANTINTMCERVAQQIPQWVDVRIGLRILTNLSDKRTAKATCLIPASALHSDEFDGHEAVRRIEQAFQFAWHDPYRAVTHNKGIMNGIDPVVIATGNDWRAVEAAAHAWAARDGHYRSLSTWHVNASGDLDGSLEMPIALGTVGGVTRLHPTAQAALRLMGSPGAQQLAEIAVAVGLAQNLSALRALALEGIQRGHMGLHQANLDLAQKQGKR